VTHYYDIDEANARLPEARELLAALREQRAELIRLRDEARARIAVLESPGSGSSDEDVFDVADGADDLSDDPEIRRLRLRMRGIIDQMQGAVGRLVEWDITLRDIRTGLIDFPALASGRQVWLCWRLGEGPIEWWHDLSAGFAGRRPIIDLT
jgi:hypothetical protein